MQTLTDLMHANGGKLRYTETYDMFGRRTVTVLPWTAECDRFIVTPEEELAYEEARRG